MYKFLVMPLADMPDVNTFLTDSERHYYENLKIEKRRRDFALGRYVLKTLLKRDFTDAEYKDIEVLRSESGVPEMTVNGKKTDVNISISHSNSYGAACASTKAKVGIDIELIEERSASWAEMCFTNTELRLGSGPEYLTALWTKKEAVAKVLGIGLIAGMQEISFEDGKVNFYGKLKNEKEVNVEVNADLKNFVTAIAWRLL